MKRIVVLSDLHLGDPASALECEPGKEPDLGWFQKGLKELGIEKVDHLVLAGDVLDFSIGSFTRSYSVARRFFTSLRKLELVEEIIYIPGNHDKDVWDSVQKEVNVFMRLRNGRGPSEFPYEQPGIIDNSDGGDGRLYLPGVDYARGRKRKKQYGALYLEGLFPKNEPLPVSVVYPSLYLILPEGRWMLVTHGHLFELAWVFITEVFERVLVHTKDDPSKGGLEWLEECNIPVNSLICTGLGQGGPSSRLIRRIQTEVKKGKVKKLAKVLNEFLSWADERLDYVFPLEVAQDIFFNLAERLILNEVKKLKPSRGSTRFLKDKKDLIGKFLEATRLTVGSLKGKSLPDRLEEYPDCVIFGHTHVPIQAEKPQTLNVSDSGAAEREIKFLNTGSCLRGESSAMLLVDEKGNCLSWRKDFASRRE